MALKYRSSRSKFVSMKHFCYEMNDICYYLFPYFACKSEGLMPNSSLKHLVK